MLGWEFPPVVNGGLGVACRNLSEALGAFTPLTMIVPRADARYRPENLQLLGLNEVSLRRIRRKILKDEIQVAKKVRLEYVDVDIRAYDTVERVAYREEERPEVFIVEREVEEEESIGQTVPVPRRFQVSDLYGDDLIKRVVQYAEITARLATTLEFDVVHAHDWMTFLSGLMIKAHTGKPLVLHIHSLEYDRSGPESQGWVYELEKHAVQQADTVIAVSEYTRGILVSHYQAPAHRVKVIHNSVEKMEVKRQKPPFSEKLVVFLGRLTGQKGPASFVEAARQLLRRRKDIRFVMAGDGDLRKGLTEQVARFRMGDRFHFAGFLSPEQARSLLAMADVFVMPSVSEPFGLSALEAARAGVPCVLSSRSGASEILHHALQIDPNSPEALSRQVEWLIDHPMEAREIVQQTLTDLGTVSWDQAAQEVLKVYRSVMAIPVVASNVSAV